LRNDIGSEEVPPIVESTLGSYSYHTHKIPTLDELLTTKYDPFPYEKNFEENKDEPLVVLHTSGTTEFPKPIVWTHDWAASFIEWQQMDPPEDF
jgi:acyl-coenzyme A synthetase/AMP-(fatty) acid ligase